MNMSLPASDVNISPKRDNSGMHESVFKNRFRDGRCAAGQGHQRHELRLQIGGEARVRIGCNIHWTRAIIGRDCHLVLINLNIDKLAPWRKTTPPDVQVAYF